MGIKVTRRDFNNSIIINKGRCSKIYNFSIMTYKSKAITKKINNIIEEVYK